MTTAHNNRHSAVNWRMRVRLRSLVRDILSREFAILVGIGLPGSVFYLL
jgi:hypothetical protein